MITQSNYLPWIGYFKLINSSDLFLFYDGVQYTKNDWRNRNRIISNEKSEWLTIPIAYRFFEKKKINEIKLPITNWKADHLKRIKNAYRATSYFDQYYPILEDALGQNYLYLADLNQKIIQTFAAEFDIKAKFVNDFSFDPNMDKTERLISICNSYGGTEYITTPKSLMYLRREDFIHAGITLNIIDFNSCQKPYPQKIREFDPYVSFIDYIFNQGSPQSQDIFSI